MKSRATGKAAVRSVAGHVIIAIAEQAGAADRLAG
jgi:hypothetical protein